MRFSFEEFVMHGLRPQLEEPIFHSNAVLSAVAAYPWDEFLPASAKPYLRSDGPIPLGSHRHLEALPLLMKMMALLEPSGDKRVVDVAPGCAYGVAVLASMGVQSVMVEPDPETTEALVLSLIEPNLRDLIQFVPSLGAVPGLFLPVDGVWLHGVVDRAPDACLRWLKVGGRLVALEAVEGLPVQGNHSTRYLAHLVSYERHAEDQWSRTVYEVVQHSKNFSELQVL